MARVFLAVWLAFFTVQASDLLAAVAPDECSDEDRGAADEPCPELCPRCVCCAHFPVFVPQVFPALVSGILTDTAVARYREAATSAEPHGILHVPKFL